MTKEELDFIGSMNMCDEISNEAYKKIVSHVEETEISDDCVSRADLLAQINESWETIETKIDFVNIVKASPPVRPTHGTCKDCKHCGAYLCGYTCYKGHWGKISKESNYGGMGDWYCADFEKRDNNKPKTYIDCQKCENYRNPDYSKCMECGKRGNEDGSN